MITGATSGIGKAAAFALARKPWELILIGRNKEKLIKTSSAIKRETGNERVGYYVCDLSLLREVRNTAERLKNDHARLDVMINNAGGKFLRHQTTEEGIELTLATNHLGHFLLTLSLLDLMKRSGDARIINVSSGAHYSGGGVIRNITAFRDYDGRAQYADSKLANVLFTYALARKLAHQGVTANAVDPGGVATNFTRNNGIRYWIKHIMYYAMKGHLLTPKQGAKTVVFLASAPDMYGITGKYFFDLQERTSSAISYDEGLQAEMWEASARLCGIALPPTEALLPK